ncbi:oxidoreductase, aldo/keto reductase family [Myxococcus xanthus DK 1622]|uniref:Oxidoreductase, aldo/keto reductase family n=1 Tax=Myxococcus xanthus (strain DK1622) TaxID=246197 RepID=Q1DAG3_MYXXD|nr:MULTISPECIES: aldo/keto reductase [Myxococcus]ABF89294.1 oxidoreductase, aldo/keto reductase family [Myxococcus xanthus DK 1622]NOJ56572.1 aldo/keto reductase [Myxococcus xanthus]QPM81684.1 aldo/keto reductase [Myxococcus xanthus]QQR46414.1 aldo/keto reductase [Myxococcus xanthus]QVW70935.1 aldo/keto reductase [Myxococcus xanthus DZ2]
MSTRIIDSLAKYHLLGQTGLRVSPLALGTMNFGTDWGWGITSEDAHRLLTRYLEAGGNFIDTADAYTSGSSERIIGDYFAKHGGRERAVIATKFSANLSPGDPNAGGNSRKHIYAALEGSLRRLKMSYVDVYWLHVWDGLTPVEEVMGTLTGLVREGKVRYIGFSDVPAWYFARAQTLAERNHWEKVAALQLEYSLAERNVEREHLPAALAMGAALTPWSPLAGGLLTGRYTRDGNQPKGDGRAHALLASGNPVADKFLQERPWAIVEELVAVAKEVERSPAQVALNWVATRPAVVSTIIGASRLEQLEDNLHALDFKLPHELSARLDAASRPELFNPYVFFENPFFTKGMLAGNTTVSAEPSGFRGPLQPR